MPPFAKNSQLTNFVKNVTKKVKLMKISLFLDVLEQVLDLLNVLVYLLQHKKGVCMARRKTVKELDADIERLKRQVELEELRQKLAAKKRRSPR